MLRFPYNKRLILITTVGVIQCEIIKATELFVMCVNLEYQNISIPGSFYLERSSIVGFSIISVKNFQKNNEPIVNETTEGLKSKILQFDRGKNKICN